MATNEPIQPTGFVLVTEGKPFPWTTGFVETKGPRGACFIWYQLVNNVWKETHILHEENWMLKNGG